MFSSYLYVTLTEVCYS